MFARFIYNHPRYFVLLILCVLAVGLNSYQLIPRQEKPTLVNMIGNVTTFYPGATPARVESLVTTPLEDEIRRIKEVDEIFSTSATGISSINVRIDDTLPDERLEQVWSEVRDAIADARALLTAEASEPVFESDRLTAFTSIL
ncbi:MAG: efflux RND transporter permease subunit, partial [Halioglobus sp.]